MKYIIKDWMNNTCFHGKEFSSFDDAWGFIYNFHDDDEEYFQEYHVVLKESNKWVLTLTE